MYNLTIRLQTVEWLCAQARRYDKKGQFLMTFFPCCPVTPLSLIHEILMTSQSVLGQKHKLVSIDHATSGHQSRIYLFDHIVLSHRAFTHSFPSVLDEKHKLLKRHYRNMLFSVILWNIGGHQVTYDLKVDSPLKHGYWIAVLIKFSVSSGYLIYIDLRER